MEELEPGIYELLVTERLREQLAHLSESELIDERVLNRADASDRIAWHVSRQVERVLLDVSEDDRVAVGIQVARSLIERLGELVADAADPGELPVAPAAVLHAVLSRRPDGTPEALGVPPTSLLDTTLLTNAPGEPRLIFVPTDVVAAVRSVEVAPSTDGSRPVSAGATTFRSPWRSTSLKPSEAVEPTAHNYSGAGDRVCPEAGRIGSAAARCRRPR